MADFVCWWLLCGRLGCLSLGETNVDQLEIEEELLSLEGIAGGGTVPPVVKMIHIGMSCYCKAKFRRK